MTKNNCEDYSTLDISIKDDAHITAWLDGKIIGTLELDDVDGDDKWWVVSVNVDKEYRRHGVGKSLVCRGVQCHGEVYFADGMERIDGDTRHLSSGGTKLMSSALREGIIKEEWCYNPFFRHSSTK